MAFDGLIETVRLERDRHVAFAFAAADLLIETDLEGSIVSASGAAQGVLGLRADMLNSRPLSALVARADRPLLAVLLRQISSVGRIDPCVISLLRADGGRPRVLLGGCRLPRPADRLFLSITLLPTIISLGSDQRDAETGLLSAEALQHAAQQAASEGLGGTRELRLLHLDGLAHATRSLPSGSAALLLEEIGAALRAASVGGDGAGRLGDEAFGILAKSGQGPETTNGLIDSLKNAIRSAGVPEGRIGPRQAHIELFLAELSESDAARALQYAIGSFVAAQGQGYSITSLQDGLTAAVAETTGRFRETRRMIDRGAFRLAYQPVASLANRGIHHYEALSRFEGGASTFDTIAFSEDVGLISGLDIAVCARVIEVLQGNPQVSLAVNLSGRSVQNEEFRLALSELVRPLVTLRNRLLFELTESATVTDIAPVANFIRWLRQLGHAVCLDDFGAGAAAYSYIRHFDVDFVKIDGQFLKAATMAPRERALIRSICVLCRELGCQVIGEMIEDEGMLTLAASLGIDLGQGWLIGKPVDELPRNITVGRRRGVRESWE